MIGIIWFFLIALGIAIAGTGGTVDTVTAAMIDGAEKGVQVCLGLVGIMSFWMGMMRLATKSGLTRAISRLLSPLVRLLFPSVPAGHPATGAIAMSMAANMLGLGNASTPLGIKAMEQLQKLNPSKSKASDAMCTLTVITTSSLTLIPATVIALRSSAGSAKPAAITGSTLIATLVSTLVAIMLDRIGRRVMYR